MGNLSLFQPEESKTVLAIYAWWEKMGEAEAPRNYLGASIIGHECDRYLWFSFRQCFREKFEGRMLRLFDTGHREEIRFSEDLRGIGCQVETHDANGKQIGVIALGGHLRGHLDAVALGVPEAPATWHVAEFKTHSSKSFEKLKREGVKASNPQHWTQMQVYMGLTKITRALYLARNKDTDELYSERVHFDATAFKAILARAKRIIEATAAPDRIAGRSDDWRCKFCCHHDLCWGQSKVVAPIEAKTCRTCCHATAITDGDGGWHCERHKKALATGEVNMACDHHLLLPSLVYGSSPVDAGDDWIEFVAEDGTKWRHGRDYWTTEELAKISASMLASHGINAARELFDGKVVAVEPPAGLLDRYPHEDTERLWDGPAADLKDAVAKHVPGGMVITEKEETNDHLAVEYGQQIIVVIYKKDQYAAIWSGKE